MFLIPLKREMDFDFNENGPVDYIVSCYEQIPKGEASHRHAFLTFFLESYFRDPDGRIGHFGITRSYTALGEGQLENMLNSTIEELEPFFYEVCTQLLGYKSNKKQG